MLENMSAFDRLAYVPICALSLPVCAGRLGGAGAWKVSISGTPAPVVAHVILLSQI